MLSRAARLEQQRALSARAHLRRLEEMLRSAGTRAIVLKGGATLAFGGEPLDLADVDVYLEPEAGLSVALPIPANSPSQSGHVIHPVRAMGSGGEAALVE